MFCFEYLLYKGSLTVGRFPLVLRYTWLGQPDVEPTVLSISDPVPLGFDGHQAPESKTNKQIDQENITK